MKRSAAERPASSQTSPGVDSLRFADSEALERTLRAYLPNALKPKHVISDISVRPNLTLELGEKKIAGQGRVLEGLLRTNRAIAYGRRSTPTAAPKNDLHTSSRVVQLVLDGDGEAGDVGRDTRRSPSQ